MDTTETPEDTGITNERRVEYARCALEAYREAKMHTADEDEATVITDLIADVLHLSAVGTVAEPEEGTESTEDVISRVLRLALLHFDAEHNNPEETQE